MVALGMTFRGGEDVHLFIDKTLEQVENELSEQIVIESRHMMDESIPAGRIYRRGGFRRGHVRGLGGRASGPGTRFHRASAKGQPPAKDTGNLYRDIKVSRTGRGRYRVTFGAGYAGYLEFWLNRPLVLPAIERAVDKVFNQ